MGSSDGLGLTGGVAVGVSGADELGVGLVGDDCGESLRSESVGSGVGELELGPADVDWSAVSWLVQSWLTPFTWGWLAWVGG